MTPSIRLEAISKAYGGTLALDRIDLRVDGPVCLGILGPNGAGKTTMLKIITNISRPTGGVALVNGINVSEDPQKALSAVGSLIRRIRRRRFQPSGHSSNSPSSIRTSGEGRYSSSSRR